MFTFSLTHVFTHVRGDLWLSAYWGWLAPQQGAGEAEMSPTQPWSHSRGETHLVQQ